MGDIVHAGIHMAIAAMCLSLLGRGSALRSLLRSSGGLWNAEINWLIVFASVQGAANAVHGLLPLTSVVALDSSFVPATWMATQLAFVVLVLFRKAIIPDPAITVIISILISAALVLMIPIRWDYYTGGFVGRWPDLVLGALSLVATRWTWKKTNGRRKKYARSALLLACMSALLMAPSHANYDYLFMMSHLLFLSAFLPWFPYTSSLCRALGVAAFKAEESTPCPG